MIKYVLTFLLTHLLFVAVQGQVLHIHHINVGQGDAILIVSPSGRTLLIDGGDKTKGTSVVLPYLKSLHVTKIDHMIASHYHSDHIGGLIEILNSFDRTKVGLIYDRGTLNTVPSSGVYSAYSNAVQTLSGGHRTVSIGMTIDLGDGVSLKCLATDGAVLGQQGTPVKANSENDLSNAWLVTFGEFKYFTGGDCGGETSNYNDLETLIATKAIAGKVDALKINHHGSAYSTNKIFIDTLKPTAAIITVGSGNRYHHPVQSTLDRLAASGSYTYLTEGGSGGLMTPDHGVIANGNIVISTTGHNSFSVAYGISNDTFKLHDQKIENTPISLELPPINKEISSQTGQ